MSIHATEFDSMSLYSKQDIECKIRQQKLRMKTSIDNALNILKTPLPTVPPSAGMLPHEAVYTTSPPAMIGSTSLESSPATSAGHEFPQSWERRPSLPQIFDTPPHPAHGHSMSTSQAQGTSHHPVKSSGRPSFSSSRRPRSAGTDADSSVMSTSSTPGRLRGKLSLLSMFKKAAGESPSSASPPGMATPESRDSFTGNSSALASSSPSPVPERERGDGQRRARSRGASAHSPLRTRASETGPLSAASGLSPPALSTVPSTRSRLGSASESESPYPPLAVELHRKLSMERLRSRSGSGSSSTQNPSTPAERAAQSPSPQHAALPQSQPQSHRSPPPRSGILRPHGRSASSGQSTFQRPSDGLSGEGSARSLRFGPSSTGASAVHAKRSGLNLDLKGSGSISSLRGETQGPGPSSPRSPWSTSSRTRLRERERDPSVDATNHRHRNYTIMDDEDEEGYGEVISPRIGLGLALESEEGTACPDEPQPLLEAEAKAEAEAEAEAGAGVEERPPSTDSQASRESPPPSFSPTAPPESRFDCPFSINRPLPPEPLPLDATISSSSPPLPLSQSQASLLAIRAIDNRARGDSFGSMSTSTDASLPVTPAPGPALALALEMRSPDARSLDLPLDDDFPGAGLGAGRMQTDSSASTERKNCLVERERQHSSRARTMSPPPSRSRAHRLDIDIRAISSHAQA